jgi:hypothetical protein
MAIFQDFGKRKQFFGLSMPPKNIRRLSTHRFLQPSSNNERMPSTRLIFMQLPSVM